MYKGLDAAYIEPIGVLLLLLLFVLLMLKITTLLLKIMFER
jgi:hypothetical protein